jgi:uncharacterized peroxidase-related enzyme
VSSGRDEAAADAWIAALAADHTRAPMAEPERAMLEYAIALTRSPASVTKAHVDALREHGFDDRAIHDLCCIAAYYAFVNRVADGLGVDLEDRFGGNRHAADLISGGRQ